MAQLDILIFTHNKLNLKSMKYELSNEEKNALFALLNRANLTGQEVPAFNKLVNIFSNPIIEKPAVKNEEEKIDKK